MEKSNIKMSSNKSFGIVFSIFFLIIGLFPLLDNLNIRIWAIIISIIFITLGLLKSKLLSPLNKTWFRFGLILGNFIAPIVMGLVFFLVVTPTSLILKLFKKDILSLKKNNKTSYWIEKDDRVSKMKDQF
tara:strand:+ start:712 stop:1101 length:390 start_codon:yes stop_codon:yes gene_type:complete